MQKRSRHQDFTDFTESLHGPHRILELMDLPPHLLTLIAKSLSCGHRGVYKSMIFLDVVGVEWHELAGILAKSESTRPRLVLCAVELGMVRVSEWLLEWSAKNNCVMDKTTKNLAWKATYNGNLAVLQFLVKHGFAWDSRECAKQAMTQKCNYQKSNNYKDTAETKKRKALCEWIKKF